MKFQTLILFLCLALALTPASAETNPKQEPQKQESPYKAPTVKNFSQLFWALSRLDPEEDRYIDNYILINECSIYKDYFHNEFEWDSIRDLGRKNILENKHTFPLRFEFIQPLKLGKYNFEKQGFEILEDYQIDGIRRFEIQATDYLDPVCGYSGPIPGYPKAVFVELSRPVLLDVLPMEKEKADRYVAEKAIEYKKLNTIDQDRSTVYDFREIYIVLKVKFFASAGDHRNIHDKTEFAKLLGVLESIEIYDDPQKEKLLYQQDYRRKKRKKTTNTPTTQTNQ